MLRTGALYIGGLWALAQGIACFEWLDRAWASRDTGIRNLLIDPFFKRYRDTQPFAAFCKKVGLPAPGKTAASNTQLSSFPSTRSTP